MKDLIVVMFVLLISQQRLNLLVRLAPDPNDPSTLLATRNLSKARILEEPPNCSSLYQNNAVQSFDSSMAMQVTQRSDRDRIIYDLKDVSKDLNRRLSDIDKNFRIHSKEIGDLIDNSLPRLQLYRLETEAINKRTEPSNAKLVRLI